jgi:formylglycine-generating enzyme required for sulfatase activity
VRGLDGIGNFSNPTLNVVNIGGTGRSALKAGDKEVNVATVGSGGIGSESAFGAADMTGNVWEGTATKDASDQMIIRGPSWSDSAANATRLAFKNPQNNVGFRVARRTGP